MTLLRVVVVSPCDVGPERDALQGVLDSVNRDCAHERCLHLDLSRWETDAYPGFHPEGPQGIIDSLLKLDEADIVIGIFWTRFGTPIVNGQTGTEHELKAAIESWRKKRRPQVMVYFNCASYSPKDSAETDQWSRVLKFKEDFPKEGLWWPYEGKDCFARLVEGHLRRLIVTPISKIAKPSGENKIPKLNFKYALTILAIFGLLFIATTIYTSPKKKTPLILLGSSNVHSYLKEHVSPSVWSDIGPIWFDLASGDTQTTAYGAFANGISNRQDLGFIAMSSDGSNKLAERFGKAKKDGEKTDGLEFLNIIIARRPLTVFYRISSAQVLSMLNIQHADHLPAELGDKPSQRYSFVYLSDLKKIIRPSFYEEVNVKLFLTRGNSGTKRLFAQAAAQSADWENLGDWSRFSSDIPKNIEDFTNSSFIEILSEPQRSNDSSGTCANLRKHNIEAAVICTGDKSPGVCQHVVQAEYVLMFKLQRTEEQLGYAHEIPNKRECEFARELDKRFLNNNRDAKDFLTADCKIESDALDRKADPDGHIYTRDLDLKDRDLPEYLSCGTNGADLASSQNDRAFAPFIPAVIGLKAKPGVLKSSPRGQAEKF